MNILTPTIRALVPRPIRNALRNPSNTLRRIRQKIKFIGGTVETVQPLTDWKVRCHPICKEGFEIFDKEDDQKAEMMEFRAHCRPNMKLLDVGAHWGVFALAASHFSNRTAKVVCVEPSPAAIKINQINVKLNGLEQSIQFVQAAAGANDSELRMLTSGAGGADYFLVPHEKRPDTVTVRQVALDSLCQDLKFRPTHFKLDVEGFEEEALSGAKNLLLDCRPELFLELHGDLIRRRGRNPRAVLNLLIGAGYNRWSHNGRVIDVAGLEVAGFNARIACLPADYPNR